MHLSPRTFDAYRQEQLDAAMPVLIFELFAQNRIYINKPHVPSPQDTRPYSLERKNAVRLSMACTRLSAKEE
jgi:hypothetical protein